MVITFAGISEIKAAEREIEAARAYLDSIIATIRQPLVVLDEELRVISASSSFHRVFSVKPEDLIGRHLLAAGDHLDVPALREFLASIQARGTTINDHEVEIELPEPGTTGILDERSRASRGAFERSARSWWRSSTSPRRSARARRWRPPNPRRNEPMSASRAFSRPPAMICASHCKPSACCRACWKSAFAMKPTLKLVHRLDETVSTMSSMLDKLLDINQLEAGIVRPAIVDFPIKRLLEEMRTEFTYHTATNGLDWRVVPSSLTVRSDPRLLEQIIRNLLSNAVKYTTEGKLLLGCRRRGDKLRIEVWDTGPGIPELELQAIFEEFHQLDNPARERSKGLGLGLAIVQRLADLLGHKIDVRSRLGNGLGLHHRGAAWATRGWQTCRLRARRRRRTSTPSRGTILIVEDDPAVLEMLQLLFDDEGHRTLVAADGHKALELAAQGRPCRT